MPRLRMTLPTEVEKKKKDGIPIEYYRQTVFFENYAFVSLSKFLFMVRLDIFFLPELFYTFIIFNFGNSSTKSIE